MTSPTPQATPDPAFTAALEWQLRSELRRDALASPLAERGRGRRRPWPRSVTLVAVAVASGLAGAVCLGAVQQVQESRRAQVIVAGLSLREAAARQAAAAAKRAHELAQAQFNAGTAPATEQRRAGLRAAIVEATASLTSLELAEARASQHPPRDELSAPLIQGRDFVLERLQVQLAVAQRRADDEGANSRDLRLRIDAGLAGIQDVEDSALASTVASLHLSNIAERIGLRAKFHGRQLNAQAVEAADLRTRAKLAQAVADANLAAAAKRLARVQTLRDTGHVSEADVTEARLAELNAQLDVEIAKAEAAALDTAAP